MLRDPSLPDAAKSEGEEAEEQQRIEGCRGSFENSTDRHCETHDKGSESGYAADEQDQPAGPAMQRRMSCAERGHELKWQKEEEDCRGQNVQEGEGLLCDEVIVETDGCARWHDGQHVSAPGYGSEADEDEKNDSGPQKAAHTRGYEGE